MFVYYGNKPNASFLQFYGFVIENNEHDQVTFVLDLDPQDPLETFKRELLPIVKYPQEIKVTQATEDPQFARLMGLLRLVVYEGSEEELWAFKYC